MKKLTAMLLALTLCFGLAACGGNTAQDDTEDESQTVQTGKTEGVMIASRKSSARNGCSALPNESRHSSRRPFGAFSCVVCMRISSSERGGFTYENEV